MAASAIEILSSANSRALSSTEFPRAAAIVCAITFQWPGGVSVPAPSDQNRAISVWSGVRRELVLAPSVIVRLRSSAYWSLMRAGGAGGRNPGALGTPKGATAPQPGRSAGAKAGGVGTQSPGLLPGV